MTFGVVQKVNERIEQLDRLLTNDWVTFKMTGLYGFKLNKDRYDINDNICIVKNSAILNDMYISKYNSAVDPEYYILSIARDESAVLSSEIIKDINVAKCNINLFFRAACIYYGHWINFGEIKSYRRTNPLTNYGLNSVKKSGNDFEILEITKINNPMLGDILYQHENVFFDNDFIEFYNSFLLQYIESAKSFKIGTKKFFESISSIKIEDTILSLATVIEIFFNKEDLDSITKEISYKIALLVGKNYEERIKIQKSVKDFYSLRSKLIHGNNFEIIEKDVTNTVAVIKSMAIALKKIIVDGQKKVEDDLKYMMMLGSPKHDDEKYVYYITYNEIKDYYNEYHHINIVLEKSDNDFDIFTENKNDYVRYYEAFEEIIKRKYNINIRNRYSYNYYIDDVNEMIFVITVSDDC